jgi:DNA anti-recombination protein RmuC
MKSILLQFKEQFQIIKLQTMKDITKLIENQKRDLISSKTEIIQVIMNQMNEKDVIIDNLNSQLNLNHQQHQINLEQERNQIQRMNDILQQSKQEWEEKIENYFKSSELNQSESDRLRLLFLDHLSHSQIYQKDPDEIHEVFQSFLDNETEFSSFFDD